MKYRNLIINFFAFFAISFFMIIVIGKNPQKNTSPYWLVLAVCSPIILSLIFPKLRKMGIGTSDFFPNLFIYLKDKL